MPRFGDVVIAPGFSGTVSNGFGIIFYVSNTTNPTENQGAPGPGAAGRSPRGPFGTIQAAVNAAVAGRGDVIVVQRGTYSEDVTVDKNGLTILGAVPYGYPDHVIIQGRTVVRGSGISTYNMEFFSNSASRISLKVGDDTTESVSFWAENCSFSSDGTTEPLCGAMVVGGNDHTFKRCRFIDNTNGLAIHSGISSYVSGLTVEDCRFLENTTADITNGSVLPDAGYVGGINYAVRNVLFMRNYFGAGLVTPTDFIIITDGTGTSNGFMAENVFASATNASATITIPSTIEYGPNGTRAGWSTAVPA